MSQWTMDQVIEEAKVILKAEGLDYDQMQLSTEGRLKCKELVDDIFVSVNILPKMFGVES